MSDDPFPLSSNTANPRACLPACHLCRACAASYAARSSPSPPFGVVGEPVTISSMMPTSISGSISFILPSLSSASLACLLLPREQTQHTQSHTSRDRTQARRVIRYAHGCIYLSPRGHAVLHPSPSHLQVDLDKSTKAGQPRPCIYPHHVLVVGRQSLNLVVVSREDPRHRPD